MVICETYEQFGLHYTNETDVGSDRVSRLRNIRIFKNFIDCLQKHVFCHGKTHYLNILITHLLQICNTMLITINEYIEAFV